MVLLSQDETKIVEKLPDPSLIPYPILRKGIAILKKNTQFDLSATDCDPNFSGYKPDSFFKDYDPTVLVQGHKTLLDLPYKQVYC